MDFGNIYKMMKHEKQEYTSYSYRAEMKDYDQSELDRGFNELEFICDSFDLPGQMIDDKTTSKESLYYKKHKAEAENVAYLKDENIIFETKLKFEKGKEIPWMVKRMNTFYETHNKKE